MEEQMKKGFKFLISATLALSLLSACGSPASSSGEGGTINYPTKTIEIEVAASAGGDTDTNARLIAQYLTEKLGVSVVVTNVNGGGGTIASDDVKSANADGYTLLFTHIMIHSAEALGLVDYGYDAFEPVSICGQGTGELLLVRSDFPADNYEEFKAEVQANPNTYNYGYSTGGGSHVVGAILQDDGCALNMVSVGNASERIIGLAEGTLDCIISAYPTVADYIENGTFKVIGSVASERNENYPDIPTLKEQGLEKCEVDTYYTLYAPKGTDAGIIQILNDAIMDIVENNSNYQDAIKTSYNQAPFALNINDTTSALASYREMCMSVSDLMKAYG